MSLCSSSCCCLLALSSDQKKKANTLITATSSHLGFLFFLNNLFNKNRRFFFPSLRPQNHDRDSGSTVVSRLPLLSPPDSLPHAGGGGNKPTPYNIKRKREKKQKPNPQRATSQAGSAPLSHAGPGQGDRGSGSSRLGHKAGIRSPDSYGAIVNGQLQKQAVTSQVRGGGACRGGAQSRRRDPHRAR